MRFLIGVAIAISGNCLADVASVVAVPMVVDSANRVIGYYWDATGCEPPAYGVISTTGYATCVSVTNGRIVPRFIPPGSGGVIDSNLRFESADCTGPGFACSGNGVLVGGFVFNSSAGLRTVVPGAVSSQFFNASFLDGVSNSCIVISNPGFQNCLPALPFVPAETGLSSVPYSPPLRISIVDESLMNDVIFFDGFDGE